MIEELNRRLDVIHGYNEGVHDRAEFNTPEAGPPYPNRYLRRLEIEKQIEESLFSPDLEALHKSVPSTFYGPEFVRQLIEAENREDGTMRDRTTTAISLDRTEYVTVKAMRNTDEAVQRV